MRRATRSWAALLVLLVGCNGGDDDDTGADDTDDSGDTSDTADTGVPSSVRIVAGVGGQVQSPDGIFTLVVPAGAIAADTDFSITIVPQAEWPQGVAALEPIGEVYDVQPDGLVFLEPAYGVHRWTTTPAALRIDDDGYVMAGHYSVAADGTIEAAAETTTRFSDDSAEIVARLTHLSQQWTTEAIPSGGTMFVRVKAEAGDHPVTETWLATVGEVHSTAAVDLMSWAAGAKVLSDIDVDYLVPVSGDSEVDTIQGDAAADAHSYGWDGAVFGRYSAAYTEVSGQRTLEANVPLVLADPLPGWRCDAVGEGVALAIVFADAVIGSKSRRTELKVGYPRCLAPSEPGPDPATHVLFGDSCDAEIQGGGVGCMPGRSFVGNAISPSAETEGYLTAVGSTSVVFEGVPSWKSKPGAPVIAASTSLQSGTATLGSEAYTFAGFTAGLFAADPDDLVVTFTPPGLSEQTVTVEAPGAAPYNLGGVIVGVPNGLHTVVGYDEDEAFFDAWFGYAGASPTGSRSSLPAGESGVVRLVPSSAMTLDSDGMRTTPLFDQATIDELAARGLAIDTVLVGPVNLVESDTLFPGETVPIMVGRFLEIPVALLATPLAGECVAASADLTRSTTTRVSLCYHLATTRCGMQVRDTCTAAQRIGAFYDQAGPNFTFYTTSNPILPIRSTTHGTIESSVGVVNRVVGLPLDTDVTITLGVAPLVIGSDDVRFTFRRTGSVVEVLSFERVPPP